MGRNDGSRSSPGLVLVAQFAEPARVAKARVVWLASAVSARLRTSRALGRATSDLAVVAFESGRAATDVVALALAPVQARDHALGCNHFKPVLVYFTIWELAPGKETWLKRSIL